MVIVNFIGHGFQWWQGDDPNPLPFLTNHQIKFYVSHEPGRNLYTGSWSAPIICLEAEFELPYGIPRPAGDAFVDPPIVINGGERCPEHILIQDIGVWQDVQQLQMTKGREILLLSGLRIREVVQIYGHEPEQREFVVMPEHKENAFALSWLIDNMPDILRNHAEIDDDLYIFRWLVCRYKIKADNDRAIPKALNDILGENGRIHDLIR